MSSLIPLYRTPAPIPRVNDMEESMALLNALFDNPAVVRNHQSKLNIAKDGCFLYELELSGFRPDEIQVDVEGENILIKAHHKQVNEDESVERLVNRRVRIPQSIHKETIEANVNEKGHLTITGTPSLNEQKKRRHIPIRFQNALLY